MTTTPSFSFFLLQNSLLIALFLGSGALLAYHHWLGRVPSLSHFETVRVLNQRGSALVDIRSEKEFADGHIKNARHIPLKDLTDALKKSGKGNLDKSTKNTKGTLASFKVKPEDVVIVACQRGNMASMTVRQLKKHGYANAYVLEGGMSKWQEAGLPTLKTAQEA